MRGGRCLDWMRRLDASRWQKREKNRGEREREEGGQQRRGRGKRGGVYL